MKDEEMAEEWRKNYRPMGVTCIERDGVVITTQSKATRHIKNPNSFRIKDGWYELYLRDLDNAFLAGLKAGRQPVEEAVEIIRELGGIVREGVTCHRLTDCEIILHRATLFLKEANK